MAAVLLMIPGLLEGIWIWPTAWLFVATFGLISCLASGLLAVLRPASFRVRQQSFVAPREKQQPLVDSLGLLFYLAFTLCWLASIPLDVFRLKLLAAPPLPVQAIGAVSVILGLSIAYLAIGQNRFAAPTIHDQSAEAQQVIQSGLYAVVRHPFYAGMLLVYPGAALWLGSYAAAISSIGFLILTLARVVIEERYLREHLPGYGAYAKRVRVKLIPGLL
ncbi:MAG: isoprenylcysteine carboxylmethyltransferase family protein [Caulobacter sp.]|nr:isoprenylcysteine carboxylmethyltransferase family protein [Caulobacter sp.]